MKQHFLFVCTTAQQRSPTATALFAGRGSVEAKCCSIHPLAETPLTREAIQWADTIFCMEEMHRDFILREFPEEVLSKRVIVLSIPDVYYRGQPELVTLLQEKLKAWLRPFDKH